jgi:hypothetical protein
LEWDESARRVKAQNVEIRGACRVLVDNKSVAEIGERYLLGARW